MFVSLAKMLVSCVGILLIDQNWKNYIVVKSNYLLVFVLSICPVQQLSKQMRADGLLYWTYVTDPIGVMSLWKYKVYICIPVSLQLLATLT